MSADPARTILPLHAAPSPLSVLWPKPPGLEQVPDIRSECRIGRRAFPQRAGRDVMRHGHCEQLNQVFTVMADQMRADDLIIGFVDQNLGPGDPLQTTRQEWEHGRHGLGGLVRINQRKSAKIRVVRVPVVV